MQVFVRRQIAIEDATIGIMTIGEDFTCFTLEDVVRDTKIYGKTAIPDGTYPILLCESPRFSDKYESKGLGRIVPLLVDVPGYKGVRIHVGNIPEHTHGCLLVGDYWDRKSPRIGGSVAAFKRLMAVLGNGGAMNRITITDEMDGQEGKIRHPNKPFFELLQASEPTTTIA